MRDHQGSLHLREILLERSGIEAEVSVVGIDVGMNYEAVACGVAGRLWYHGVLMQEAIRHLDSLGSHPP